MGESGWISCVLSQFRQIFSLSSEKLGRFLNHFAYLVLEAPHYPAHVHCGFLNRVQGKRHTRLFFAMSSRDEYHRDDFLERIVEIIPEIGPQSLYGS